ncbi:hypothetical protein B566_EDAN009417 [Ephemera danica]|nr:hypothetical protein B566_EDAN009417 [Ephemera danica]
MAMDSKLKLIYVDAKALAEPIRFLLAYGNIEYEDYRMSHTQFQKDKSKYPYNKIPNMMIEGQLVHQSMAIARYFARQVGLAGQDAKEQLECDIMVDTLADYRLQLVSFFYDTHPESRQRKKDLCFNETLPMYLTRLEAHVKKNGGYFINGKLTWVDLVFAGVQDYLNYMAEYDLLKDYPELKALEERVLAAPAIKAWVDERPVTEM